VPVEAGKQAMSNFSAIGMSGHAGEEFGETLGRAMQGASSPPELGHAGRGHLWWQDESGAAVAAHLDERGSVACVTPFFSAPAGGTRWRVRTSAPHLDPECIHCSGADCDILEPPEELATRATVQWAVFAPYRAWLSEPRTYDLEVVAFASSLWLCRTDDELEAAQASLFGEKPVATPEPAQPLRLADRAFMPYGMFGHEGNVTQRARALLTGTVQSLARPTNRSSNSFRNELSARGSTRPGASCPDHPSADVLHRSRLGA
jgi:hypothetical protein